MPETHRTFDWQDTGPASGRLKQSSRRRTASALCLTLAGIVVLEARSPAGASLPASLNAVAYSAQSPVDDSRPGAERFLQVLLANPRPGTAFDRVCDWHNDRGTIAVLVQRLSAQAGLSEEDALDAAASDSDSTPDALTVPSDTDPGAAALVAGLLHLRHANAAAAQTALNRAAELRADSSIAHWMRGRASLLDGRFADAVAAFEVALTCRPGRSDRIEIHRDLATAHQRLLNHEAALEVWHRLEAEFPGDLRIRQDVADALVVEGRLVDALTRYESLARESSDPELRTTVELAASELLIRLGRSSEALQRLESQLEQVDPDGWRAGDIRRRIERVFRDASNLAGLIAFYDTWLQRHPDDIPAVSEVARTLATMNRSDEAITRLRDALQRAPSSGRLHQTLIRMLVRQGEIDAALDLYPSLVRSDPANADHIADWGLLALQQGDVPLEQRRTDALAIWDRMLMEHADDAPTIARVATLRQRAGAVEPALELFRRAVAIAPDDVRYREELGALLHAVGRTEDALAAWNEMAAGPRRSRENLLRLAVTLRSAGLQAHALQAMREACEMDSEPAVRLEFVRWLREAAESGEPVSQAAAALWDEATRQLDLADAQSDSEEARAGVFGERVAVLLSSGRLTAEIESRTARLATTTTAPTPDTAAQWWQLARMQDAAGRADDALVSARRAADLEPNSPRAWSLLASLYERTNRLADAADAYRQQLTHDRRGLSETLPKISRLQVRLGLTDDAFQTARELVRATPGSATAWQFLADLSLEIGRPDEAHEALRRAVLVSPNNPESRIQLARSLADEFRTAEAIDLYWQAFDSSADVDVRLAMLPALTNLALRSEQFSQLLERLEELRRDSEEPVDLTRCLAAVWTEAGDFACARDELVPLLETNPGNLLLWRQVLKLADATGDSTLAQRCQQVLNEQAAHPPKPGPAASSEMNAIQDDSDASRPPASPQSSLATSTPQEAELRESLSSLSANPEPVTAMLRALTLFMNEPSPEAGPAVAGTLDSLLAAEFRTQQLEVAGRRCSFEFRELVAALVRMRQSETLRTWTYPAAPPSVADPDFRRALLRAAVADAEDDSLQVIRELVEAAGTRQGNTGLRFAISRELAGVGLRAEALQVLDAAGELSGPALQERESIALAVSRELQDDDRTRLALQRLSRMNLAPDETAGLIRDLEAMEMSAELKAVERRASVVAELRPDVLQRRMREFETAGRKDLAAEAAWELLRLDSGGTLFTGLRPPDDRDDGGYRDVAIRALARLNRLQPLVDRYEMMLATNPESVDLLEILCELHQATGQSQPLADKRDRLARLTQKVPPSLRTRAIELENASRTSDACDLYLEILRTEPDAFARELETYVQSFERAGRLIDLLVAVRDAGFRDFSGLEETLIATASLASRADSGSPVPGEFAAALIEDRVNRLKQPCSPEMLTALLTRPELISEAELLPEVQRLLQAVADDRMSFPFELSEIEDVVEVLSLLQSDPALKAVADQMTELIRIPSPTVRGLNRNLQVLLLYVRTRRGEADSVRQSVVDSLADEQARDDVEFLQALVTALERLGSDWNPERISVLEQLVTLLEADAHEDDLAHDRLDANARSLQELYEGSGRRADARRMIQTIVRNVDREAGGWFKLDSVRQKLAAAERIQHSGYPLEALVILKSLPASALDTFTESLEPDRATAFRSRWSAAERWSQRQLTAENLMSWFEDTVVECANAVPADPADAAAVSSVPLLLECDPGISADERDPARLKLATIRSLLLDAIDAADFASAELQERVRRHVEVASSLPREQVKWELLIAAAALAQKVEAHELLAFCHDKLAAQIEARPLQVPDSSDTDRITEPVVAIAAWLHKRSDSQAGAADAAAERLAALAVEQVASLPDASLRLPVLNSLRTAVASQPELARRVESAVEVIIDERKQRAADAGQRLDQLRTLVFEKLLNRGSADPRAAPSP